ncbi:MULTISPECIES: Lsr2 family protein [unclassified Microbacterium]|uniref:histone-like nucleoid-structuring protein Lsr2 n=1 Tax=unclassified Microbacterium TaxID=2609290 RepID=UPI001605383C|nr:MULTISPECIES: Lsr2 family protein [unclassified Microbacterium]QNA93189.1 Lsr2 family protein [Microbacterium sp. Se63.02b]QYM63395.1 Lsr2 family protein [Microbacterium sp. Se5.02b]
MARRIVHQLVDDIDGSVLEVGEGETVHFSLNGASYEIDLNTEHAEELRNALEPYISAGRRAGSAGTARSSNSARSASPRKRPARNPEVAAIRAWANENGYSLSERGRIPAPVLEAYRAAH